MDLDLLFGCVAVLLLLVRLFLFVCCSVPRTCLRRSSLHQSVCFRKRRFEDVPDLIPSSGGFYGHTNTQHMLTNGVCMFTRCTDGDMGGALISKDRYRRYGKSVPLSRVLYYFVDLNFLLNHYDSILSYLLHKFMGMLLLIRRMSGFCAAGLDGVEIVNNTSF